MGEIETEVDGSFSDFRLEITGLVENVLDNGDKFTLNLWWLQVSEIDR